MDAILNYVEKYTTQLLFLQVGVLVIIFAVFLWLWFYNRKKYHHLKHQIPASVVKNYLDSIIQNSTALKSSLFRGGGLDVDGSNIPSVMPVSDLAGADTAVVTGGDNSAEVNSLRAQVAQLQAQLSEKQNTISELERNKTELDGIVKAKQERIEELERLLAQAKSGGKAQSGVPQSDFDALKKERDELKTTLQQYEIIEDDLANLKRLQQENDQLKKALQAAGGSVPEPVPMAEVAQAEPEEVEEQEMAPVDEASEEEELVAEAAEEEVEEAPASEDSSEEEVHAQANDGQADEKSPEDLLSEFEKMLG